MSDGEVGDDTTRGATDILAPGMTPGTAFLMAAMAGDKAKIDTIFANIVRDSFVTHPMRKLTRDAIAERGKVLIQWFRTLRGDKGWPLDRVLHELRRALRAHLDQLPYTPSDSVLYRVDDGIEDLAASLRASTGFHGDGVRH